MLLRLCIACLPLWILAGCSNQPNDGLDKHPVTGSVLVDGAPAEGVVVRFFRDGRAGSTNADTPLAVTKSDGSFELSTNGDGDGAVPGQYTVTFFWKTGNSPAAEDRLGGRYAKLEDSKVTVEVVSGSNKLDPFQLEKSAGGTGGGSKPPVANAPPLR
ncbi:MAG: hypothetical protein AB7O26_05140 [Planctomycetaceae bacterium]